jgi:hypothetical protein
MKRLGFLIILASCAGTKSDAGKVVSSASEKSCQSGALAGAYRSGSLTVEISSCQVEYKNGSCVINGTFSTYGNTSGNADVSILKQTSSCVLSASTDTCSYILSGNNLSLLCPTLGISANFIKSAGGSYSSSSWGWSSSSSSSSSN